MSIRPFVMRALPSKSIGSPFSSSSKTSGAVAGSPASRAAEPSERRKSPSSGFANARILRDVFDYFDATSHREIARPIAVHAVAQPWVTETASAAIRNTMRISFVCIHGSGIHRSYAILSREKKDLRDKFFTELYTNHSFTYSLISALSAPVSPLYAVPCQP